MCKICTLQILTPVKSYNLDVVISVGIELNPQKAPAFVKGRSATEFYLRYKKMFLRCMNLISNSNLNSDEKIEVIKKEFSSLPFVIIDDTGKYIDTRTKENFGEVKEDYEPTGFDEVGGLLANMADICTTRTLLMAAVDENDLTIAKWLIEKQGANVNRGQYVTGYTPLMLAAKKSNIPIMSYLISQGADINLQTKLYFENYDLFVYPGSSALEIASKCNQNEAVDLLKNRLKTQLEQLLKQLDQLESDIKNDKTADNTFSNDQQAASIDTKQSDEFKQFALNPNILLSPKKISTPPKQKEFVEKIDHKRCCIIL